MLSIKWKVKHKTKIIRSHLYNDMSEEGKDEQFAEQVEFDLYKTCKRLLKKTQ